MTGASQYLSNSQPSVPVPKAFLDPERTALGPTPLRPGSRTVPRNPSSPFSSDGLGGGPFENDPAGTMGSQLRG